MVMTSADISWSTMTRTNFTFRSLDEAEHAWQAMRRFLELGQKLHGDEVMVNTVLQAMDSIAEGTIKETDGRND